jgi:hypothetical protein
MIKSIRFLGCLALAIVMTSTGVAHAKGIRLSWETFSKDPKKVAAFRTAVAAMKARSTAAPTSASYRTSWTYWGNIHGYFGTTSPDGTVEAYIQWMKDNGYWDPKYQPYFNGVTDVTPPDALAKAIWSTCQHGTPWFYPWHRLYLYYFEKQLQASANDPTLRLPYWDYENLSYLGMPPEFTTPTYKNSAGATVSNPLYEVRRAPGWTAPATSSLNGTSTDITKSLKIKTFFPYQTAIENTPHGYVHCAVMDCPVTVMGAVPYSSNDPIFWLHHANIDRTWDCWTSITGHKNSTAATFVNKKWSFVDAKGNKVTNPVSDLFNGSLVDYVYEQGSNCGRSAPAAPQAAAAVPMTGATLKKAKAEVAQPMILATVKKVAINAMVARTPLAIPKTTKNTRSRELAMKVHAELPVTTELVLKGIHYDAHPGTMFDVYLERKDNPAKREKVGTLSFFTPLRRVTHAHEAAAAHTLTETFDVTDQLRALAANGSLDDVNVVFEATTGRMGGSEKPHLNTKAGLVVDEIMLDVKAK